MNLHQCYVDASALVIIYAHVARLGRRGDLREEGLSFFLIKSARSSYRRFYLLRSADNVSCERILVRTTSRRRRRDFLSLILEKCF